MQEVDIILASTSPRRREYLSQIGVKFRVVPSDAPEDFDAGTPAVEVVKLLAERKAAAVGRKYPESLVIAADTVVAIDEEVLNKPLNDDDAREMLERLSNRTHSVFTGVCMFMRGETQELFAVRTDVTFGTLSLEMIERYVATGESRDKAGAYGIQGAGAVLVQSITGSFFNVAGMPLFEVAQAILRLGGPRCILQKT